ncbi:hypothetical protein ADK55_07530 [Streptomyces sp. WM4235]|uniref:STAS domain-containing protein n=1 Tax=Streptomyces sp. WM4235 TaxID=1415551 RepID=UPI0006C44089|nr:STAS domain-containing protein [Streptomyces sp. WM4235]KOU64657.1 hypothetical protein ADK55_07530 [Streptomyces sp. WM4235]
MDDPLDPLPPVGLESEEQHVVIRVGGEMDLDRAPMLQEALHSMITRPDCPAEIVVDLSELTFCDSSGLNVLIQSRRTAQENGRRISLRAPSPQILQLLELTCTENLFPLTDT